MKRTWVGVVCALTMSGVVGSAAAQKKGGVGGAAPRSGGGGGMDWGSGSPKASVKLTKFEDDAPWPGREKIVPGAPTWCGALKPADARADMLEAEVGRSLDSRGFSDETLAAIATDACKLPNDPTMQNHVARWRQKSYTDKTKKTLVIWNGIKL